MTKALSQLILKRGLVTAEQQHCNELYQIIEIGAGIRIVDVGQPNVLVHTLRLQH